MLANVLLFVFPYNVLLGCMLYMYVVTIPCGTCNFVFLSVECCLLVPLCLSVWVLDWKCQVCTRVCERMFPFFITIFA